MLRLVTAALLFFSAAVCAAEPVPALYERLGVIDNRGDGIPLETLVFDASGETQPLKTWLSPQHPTLLTFNYLGCPMLCGLQQDGLARAMQALELSPGLDFRVLTVSIDPLESSELAAAASERMSGLVGGEWVVVAAPQESITALTGAAGFEYSAIDGGRDYAHPAATYVLTSSGIISQYFTTIEPPSRSLKLALVEAGEGQVGSVLEQVTLACLQYDLDANSYVARDVMKGGGFAVLGGLIVFLGMLWRRERHLWR